MARRILQIKLRIGPQIQERIHWDVSDALLLLPAWRIPEVPTLDRLLIIWFKLKKRLQLDPDVTAIPRYLPIRSLQEIWRLQARQESAGFSWLEAEARRRGLKVWEDIPEHITEDGDIALILASTFPDVLQWLRNLQCSDDPLWLTNGWSWKNGWSVDKSWFAPAHKWLLLAASTDSSFSKLDRWWEVQSGEEVWQFRWKKLWASICFAKHKVWFWRFLQQGFPTLARAEQWGVSDGVCRACFAEQENTEHLFWSCPSLRQRRQWVSAVVVGNQTAHPTFLQTIDESLNQNGGSPARFFLLIEHCKTSWTERNALVFEGRRGRETEDRLLEKTMEQIQAYSRRMRGESRQKFLDSSENFRITAEASIREFRYAPDPAQIFRFKTSRGRDAISFNGYSYRLDRRSASGDLFWRCLTNGCRGRLQTDEEMNQPVVRGGDHSHPSSIEDGMIRVAYTRMRERAVAETTPIPHIYQEEANRLASSEAASAMLPVLQSIDTALYRELADNVFHLFLMIVLI
ncbi:hypothetical protein R1sor_013785 [Riccia sorocarpa]|uniref:Reverse transcriptase zinc-binding domain-containing protein n=1 Tax=Riccia sorocarpa TaxID=122646 RepID=A0ABD3HBP0_9MARC